MPNISTLSADFTSDYGPFVNVDPGVTRSDGFVVFPMNTNYPSLRTASDLTAMGGSVYARMLMPTTSETSGDPTLMFGIESPTVGTRTIVFLLPRTNQIRFAFESGYWDNGNVTLTYDPVAHAYVRFRETSGTAFIETSPDAATWTVRRTIKTPAYYSATSLAVNFTAWSPTASGDVARLDSVGIPPATEPEPEPTTTPGEILNIGPSAGQNHFDVQIAPTSGTWFTKTQAEIAAGYTDPAHFYVSGDKVVFRPRADGDTTSGTSFARDELREVNADGSQIAFDPLTGEHVLELKATIVHAPEGDPDVVIAQLHNGDADRISIRTQMFSSGGVVLGVRINGSLHSTRFVSANSYANAQGTVFGVEHHIKIRLIDGTAEIYYADMVTPKITSTALVPTTHPDGWYFKAGAYNQFNETATGATGLTVAADEYSEVMLRDLVVAHPAGTVAPAEGSATLSTVTSVSATGRASRAGSAAVSTSTTLGAAGRAPRRGTGDLETVTTVSAAGATSRRGAASLSTSSTVTASGETPRAGSASVTTTTATTAAGTVTRRGAGSLSSSTVLAASGRTTRAGGASVASQTILEASGSTSVSGSANLSTGHTVAASGETTREGSTGLSTGTSVGASGSNPAGGTATLRTTTTTTASGEQDPAGAANLTTTTATTASGRTPRAGSATLTTTTTVAASGRTTPTGSATLETTTTGLPAGETTREGSAAITTTHTITTGGYNPAVDEAAGSASLSTTTTLEAAGTTSRGGSADLVTGTAWDVSGHTTRAGGAGLDAVTALSTGGHAPRAGTAALVTATTATTTGTTTRGGSAGLTTSHTVAAGGYAPAVDGAGGSANLTTLTIVDAAGETNRKGAAHLSTSTGWGVTGRTDREGSGDLRTATTLEATGTAPTLDGASGTATLTTTHTATATGLTTRRGALTLRTAHEVATAGLMAAAGSATLTTETTLFFAVGTGWEFTSAEFGESRYAATVEPREYTTSFGRTRWETSWQSP